MDGPCVRMLREMDRRGETDARAVGPYTFCSQRIAKRGSGEKRCGEMWKNKERKFYNLRKKYYLCARKSNSHRPIESVQEEFTAPLSRRMKGLCTNIKQNETRYPSRKLPRGSIQRHVKRRSIHLSLNCRYERNYRHRWGNLSFGET